MRGREGGREQGREGEREGGGREGRRVRGRVGGRKEEARGVCICIYHIRTYNFTYVYTHACV